MNKTWLAPAKINRFLHITGQREDGYHELQTVFQFLNYADELQFKVLEHNDIVLIDALPGVSTEDNLIIKAARLLQNKANCTKGVEIKLTKRLPMGGGLGGGSSDAATTLVALNQLWEINMGMPELAELGVALGADVPIFIHGRAAWAEGIGEKITAIHLDEPWFIVMKPDVHVSTADIFTAPQLQRDCIPLTIDHFLSGQGINVCEPVVCELYPEVEQALDWLKQYAPARMTGTGACVFAPMNSADEAQKILFQCPEQYHAFIAQGCNVSPLYSID